MKTTIISFSSRKNGNCAQIGKLLLSMTEESVLFDFSELEIHACGRCNYECFEKREACVYINDMEYKMLETIAQSEAVYFVLPNYCDYPCANYFIFNERSQCYFQGRPELLDRYLRVPKRSIVVSNTNEENFVRALGYQADKEPEILFLSAKKYGKKSIDGDLLTNEKALVDIKEFVINVYQKDMSIVSIPYDNMEAVRIADEYPDLPNKEAYKKEILTGVYSR